MKQLTLLRPPPLKSGDRVIAKTSRLSAKVLTYAARSNEAKIQVRFDDPARDRLEIVSGARVWHDAQEFALVGQVADGDRLFAFRRWLEGRSLSLVPTDLSGEYLLVSGLSSIARISYSKPGKLSADTEAAAALIKEWQLQEGEDL